MNTNLTDITVILDKSGSMSQLVPATISGYNDKLNTKGSA